MKIIVDRNGKQNIIQAEPGASLLDILIQNDIYISAACGGKGKCGKCRIQMTENATKAGETDCLFLDEEERNQGWRLACMSYPSVDCRIRIESSDESDFEVVSDHQEEAEAGTRITETGYDIGIDIGTTTIAMDLIGTSSGQIRHTVTFINRQRAYGADVISRIQASNDGKGEEMKACILQDIYNGICRILKESRVSAGEVERIAIAGNTTMGHLFMGYSCETLGVSPFTPVNIGTIRSTFQEIFKEQQKDGKLEVKTDLPVLLLPGISTYVGADISAGMLACGFDRLEKPCLLLDLGTNGEMAIGSRDRILVTSTAAGPAFEGGNISCGMGSVQGAICSVLLKDGRTEYKTIGNQPPVGICGTGVIETVCELVQSKLVDETGMLDEDYFDDGFELAKTPQGEPIVFTQKDVREVQLAKSAVRAGVETLLLRYGVSYQEIDRVFLAGGFGYKINLEKTVGIGMLPEELKDKITAVGNSSLGGTVTYLTKEDAPERLERIVNNSVEVALSADQDFNRFYTDYMFFE